jgi:hypothetical protein
MLLTGAQPHDMDEAERNHERSLVNLKGLSHHSAAAHESAHDNSAQRTDMQRNNNSTLHFSPDSTLVDTAGRRDSLEKNSSHQGVPKTSSDRASDEYFSTRGILDELEEEEENAHGCRTDAEASCAHSYSQPFSPVLSSKGAARDRGEALEVVDAWELSTFERCPSDQEPRWVPGREKESFRGQGGDVVAASLNKAIEMLTLPDENAAEDDELMMALVLLHRVVSTPRVFLRKLISRFHAKQVTDDLGEGEADGEGELAVMRNKVCSIILVWLRDFYRDFNDQVLVLMLKSFLGMDLAWDEGNEHVVLLLASIKGQVVSFCEH